MFDDILEKLESIGATVFSGVCLAVSIALSAFDVAVPLWLDPAWIAVVVSGLPLACAAVRKLFKNCGISKISSALLITVAMIAAASIGDVFAAGEIAFIMALGEILEEKTVKRARKGLEALINLTPTVARLVVNGEEQTVDAQEIAVGDTVRILPGETVPVDGVIISGESSMDQSVLTGESLPIDKTVGDTVFCGAINRFGTVDIRATKVGEDASLQKLIRLVKAADAKKAPMQRTADKWASILVPLALLTAVIAGIVKQDIVVAVTVLVVFCPCALVLATPTAIMAAIGQATKHGVIIKSGEALEKMSKVDVIAFDKTGTLTYGRPEVSDIVPLRSGLKENALLWLAASAEKRSEHPLGKAIVARANCDHLVLAQPETFQMEAGKGVAVRLQGQDVFCGNIRYITEKGIVVSEEAEAAMHTLSEQGKAVVAVADEHEMVGIIGLSDREKIETKEVLNTLTFDGIQTVLLTGDTAQAAESFAAQWPLSEIHAALLPEQKAAHIRCLEKSGKTVCMIGDGINDAVALKTASVGVAMGTVGSDIAVDAADMALLGDDLRTIPYVRRLAKATVNTIRLSITLSLLINFLAIVLSFLELLDPTLGALVHNAGSCFVVLIAALLYDRKI